MNFLGETFTFLPRYWCSFSPSRQRGPFAPAEQAAGYAALAKDLKEKLCEITGYDAFSLQPNSGASGEYPESRFRRISRATLPAYAIRKAASF